jgi:hypothetical protein
VARSRNNPGGSRPRASSGRPKVSAGVARLLLADSGGYCANPDCPSPFLFRLDDAHRVDEDHVPTVRQMAHIIPHAADGPRGDGRKAGNESYENLVLLCANCHSLVDEMVAVSKFSIETLRDWKRNHRSRVREQFEAPELETRDELNDQVGALLLENRTIWQTYGPQSDHARRNPTSDVAAVWRREAREIVLPNNRRVLALIDRNHRLLTGDELRLVERFRVHARAFARTQLGNPVPNAPTFPDGFAELFNVA